MFYKLLIKLLLKKNNRAVRAIKIGDKVFIVTVEEYVSSSQMLANMNERLQASTWSLRLKTYSF